MRMSSMLPSKNWTFCPDQRITIGWGVLAGVLLVPALAFGGVFLLPVSWSWDPAGTRKGGRVLVDTGMHAVGWSRDRAIRFMLDHSALAPNNIGNEVDRYIVLPGQALAYKTGQLELLRLRAETGERLGPAFDIRGFHDTVLGSGALALPTLRGVVEAWASGRNPGS